MLLKILKHDDLPGVEIYLAQITPSMAIDFLAKNSEGQRNLNEQVAARYAEDMSSDEWPFTGSPILFDDKGELIDGQHRMQAIINSETTQMCLIVAGLPTDIIRAVDAGRKRNYATFLAMVKERPSATAQSGAIRAYWYWYVGNYAGRGIPRIAIPSELTHAVPTISQLETVREEVEQRLEITFTQVVQVAQRCYTQMPRITQVVWGMVWILLSEYDKDARERFFHELLVEPLSTAADYPINALKNRLGRIKKQGELTRTMQLHFVLTVFDRWRTGRLLPTLSAPNFIAWNTLAMPPEKYEENY